MRRSANLVRQRRYSAVWNDVREGCCYVTASTWARCSASVDDAGRKRKWMGKLKEDEREKEKRRKEEAKADAI